MKIFSADQIRAWDQYTIDHTPMTPIELMERAAQAFVDCLLVLYPNEKSFLVFCGHGNNGGDGLAIARLLLQKEYTVEVWLVDEKKLSAEAQLNYDRWLQLGGQLKHITATTAVEESEWARIKSQDLVFIDALLGTGLNRKADELYEKIIQEINAAKKKVIAVDLPSGLSADRMMSQSEVIVRATSTITFQIPKRSFFYESNYQYLGDWYVADIGLSNTYEQETPSLIRYTLLKDVKSRYIPRSPFANKGNLGRALLMAGSYGMMGAAILASLACLRAGVGLLKVYTPSCGLIVLQTAVPEAMVLTDPLEKEFSVLPDTTSYQAIGLGPGWHESEKALQLLRELLNEINVPLVIDAGALNVLSKEATLMQQIPKGSILTPHKKEFDRLAGKVLTQQEQEVQALEWAQQYNIHFVLKGKYSAVVLSDGSIHYNSTGNVGMAKGGSGDCLTGILVALLAQGYNPKDAVVLGTYMHGYAGDKAAELFSQEAMLPTDLINCLGEFFKTMQ